MEISKAMSFICMSDCSVQRRYQSGRSGPSIGLPTNVVNDLCGAGVDLAKKIDTITRVQLNSARSRHKGVVFISESTNTSGTLITEQIAGIVIVDPKYS